MARSARHLVSVAGAPVLLLTALTGCATTQQEAARLRLNSARIRASELRVRVTVQAPDVRVQGTQLIAGRGGSAIVVTLRNALARPVSDLPISVGVIAGGGRRRYLNGAPGSDYFTAHVPSIPAGGILRWVYTTRRRLASRERLFATVGVPTSPLVQGLRALPTITVATTSMPQIGAGGIRARVVVRNLSAVPQYGLQVYLVGRHAGHDVSAGRATIAHLGGRASATMTVSLVGRREPGALILDARPTVFG